MKHPYNALKHELCFCLFCYWFIFPDSAPLSSWWTETINGGWNLFNEPRQQRPECTHRSKKNRSCMSSVCQRGVGGRRGVTCRLCLFRESPPGSVSNREHWSEICLCCRREAIYFTALWKKQVESRPGCQRTASVCSFRPRLSFSLGQLAFSWHVRLPCPCPCLMRSSFWPPSNRRPTRRVKSGRRGDLSVYH